MAFNPLHTFQKNRRFWMAAILMICMVSFVFCTGMRGDMADKIIAWTTGRSGPAIVTIDGRAVSDRDLEDLRSQRNLANNFMRSCADIVVKKLAKQYFDMSRKQPDKDEEARRTNLIQLVKMKDTIDQRKVKPRYFDSGVKFDDLVEFRLWQIEADNMGIRLDEEHVKFLFSMEFFNLLSPQEISFAQEQAKRNNLRDASNAVVMRAIMEEFRVKIAQYAVLGVQPHSFLFRKRREGEGWTMKFTDPNVPDETRAPVTLAQLWDSYKAQCDEFTVTLIPVSVQDIAKSLKDEPTERMKREFFDAHKAKPYDPASDEWGLEIPAKIKVEYVYADPKSPPYLGLAKKAGKLRVMDSLPLAAIDSPLTAAELRLKLETTANAFFDQAQFFGGAPLATATRYQLFEQRHHDELETYFKESIGRRPEYRGAALIGEKDFATPVVAYMAGHDPELVASFIAASALSPQHALTGFLARGAAKHPEEIQAALRAEAKRRIPAYQNFVSVSFLAAMANNPFIVVQPYLTMDPARTYQPVPGVAYFEWKYVNPSFTVETVQLELQEIIDQRTAEEFAQINMSALKRELEKANGELEKYRRVLNKYVPEMKLTYGPSDDKKAEWHNRFTISKGEPYLGVQTDSKGDTCVVTSVVPGSPAERAGLKENDVIRKFDDKPITTPAGLTQSIQAGKIGAQVTLEIARGKETLTLKAEIGKLDEFAVLHDAYLKYVDRINLFEGRDLTPGGLLRPSDYSKMFFDKTELFSAGASLHRAMPWPPDVKPNNSRNITQANPRMFNQENLKVADVLAFKNHVDASDPNREAPKLELFKTADRPILFWRTAEVLAQRPTDYDKLLTDLDKVGQDLKDLPAQLAKVEADLLKKGNDAAKIEELRQKKMDLENSKQELEKSEMDFKEILNRITEGWKFERARSEKALPTAKDVAFRLLKLNLGAAMVNEASALNTKVIELPKLSQLHPEEYFGKGIDYLPPPLPKVKGLEAAYPRDDMMKEILSLYDLKSEIKIGNPELDAINKELFDKVNNAKGKPQGKFVQILTNKPRSIYYIAAVTEDPKTDEMRFKKAMVGARFPPEDFDPEMYARLQQEGRVPVRDHFAERVQEQESQRFHRDFIAALRIRRNVEVVDKKACDRFDERPGD